MSLALKSEALVPALRWERDHSVLAQLGTDDATALALSVRLADVLNHPTLGLDAPVAIGVTSAVPGEGVTDVALQLSTTLARSGVGQVCHLDASLTGEGIAQRVALPESGGLSDVFEDRADRISSFGCVESGELQFVPGGLPAGNPSRAARSVRVHQTLELARERFDRIVVELPALSTGNVPPLAEGLDGVLLVVYAGVTPRDLVEAALSRLAKEQVLGVVLNRIELVGPRWLMRKYVPW